MSIRAVFFFAARTAFGLIALGPLGGCAASNGAQPSSLDGGTSQDREPTLACAGEIHEYNAVPWLHVPWDTPVVYETNPPCGGAHYPVWAAYRYYKTPVDRRLYVHNLEHGAIVLLYRCASRADCPETAESLERFASSLPEDEACRGDGKPLRRIVVSPDPQLDVSIAAASWGATYRASCVDVPDLRAFVDSHYAHGLESVCTDGLEVEQ